MAYRVSKEPVNRAGFAVPHRPSDHTLTRNAAIAGATLTGLGLIAASVALLGQAHTVGSLPGYVASHKALTIAWVEPAQQAQMEVPAALAANTPAPAAAPESKAQPQVAALTGPIPLPHARPKQMLAAIPLPRGRMAAMAPELPAPVKIGSVETDVNIPDAPTFQSSPAREEGEERVASAEPASDAVAEAKADAPEAAMPSVTQTEVADAAPLPVTFGSAQPASLFQLTSYAPTREQIFTTDITGSIGNPLRDLSEIKSPNAGASAKPTPRKKGSEAKAAAFTPPKAVPETTRQLKLVKPRARSVQEKLWGSPVRLASLTPMDAGRDDDRSHLPRAPYDRQTAVYVITDRKVYLPDGTALEAHSGLGDKMDDPRFVSVRMRGATPPHVYDLTLRESLFHGVEAIRLTPIGGDGAIFGRDGLLAHTYMLGPNGQSNGCVSFKDYDTFLDAFKAGKINRLAVMAKLD
jgi:hypothetical protein